MEAVKMLQKLPNQWLYIEAMEHHGLNPLGGWVALSFMNKLEEETGETMANIFQITEIHNQAEKAKDEKPWINS